MQARQPIHRVLSWIIAFGFTVGVLIYGSFPCYSKFSGPEFTTNRLARRSRNQNRKRHCTTKDAKLSIASFQHGLLESRLTLMSPDGTGESGCRQSMPS